MRAAEEKERTRILTAPKKRAAVDKSDSYVMRRIEALSWSAEALLVGPMGKQRLFVPLPEFAYVAPSPPSLMPLLRPGEATAQELLALPVPALLERWQMRWLGCRHLRERGVAPLCARWPSPWNFRRSREFARRLTLWRSRVARRR